MTFEGWNEWNWLCPALNKLQRSAVWVKRKWRLKVGMNETDYVQLYIKVTKVSRLGEEEMTFEGRNEWNWLCPALYKSYKGQLSGWRGNDVWRSEWMKLTGYWSYIRLSNVLCRILFTFMVFLKSKMLTTTPTIHRRIYNDGCKFCWKLYTSLVFLYCKISIYDRVKGARHKGKSEFRVLKGCILSWGGGGGGVSVPKWLFLVYTLFPKRRVQPPMQE